MNRFFRTLTLIVILVFVAIVLGAKVVRALRDAAAPAPLPYGLSAQDTMTGVEQKLGQPRLIYAPRTARQTTLTTGQCRLARYRNSARPYALSGGLSAGKMQEPGINHNADTHPLGHKRDRDFIPVTLVLSLYRVQCPQSMDKIHRQPK